MKLRINEMPDSFSVSGIRQSYDYRIMNSMQLLNINEFNWDKVDARGKYKIHLPNKTVLIKLVNVNMVSRTYEIQIINLNTNNYQVYTPTNNVGVDATNIANIINII